MKNKLLISGLLTLIFMLTACGTQPAQSKEVPQGAVTEVSKVEMTESPAEAEIPAITVSDQDLNNETVTVAEVVSNGPGWIVIHAQADGKPGPILGYSPVTNGKNKNVVVNIDSANATETLYAMLHTDAGEIGTFEFPGGSDGPVTVDGQVVTPPFTVGLPMAQGTVVAVSQSDEYGSYLVDGNGMSLYAFQKDSPGVSNCYDSCANNWPPLLTSDAPTAGEGVDGGLFGTSERTDGTTQVTYNGWPLYYFKSDSKAGDLKGQGVQDVWYILSPKGEMITTAEEKIEY